MSGVSNNTEEGGVLLNYIRKYNDDFILIRIDLGHPLNSISSKCSNLKVKLIRSIST